MVNAEVIEMPDAEETLRLFVQAEMTASGPWATRKAFTKIPNPRPDVFVRILRAGGIPRSLVVDAPTLVVEAWADVESDAAALANFCRGRIMAAGRAGSMGAVTVYDDIVEYSGPRNTPDPEIGQSRYSFTHEIPMRGVVVA